MKKEEKESYFWINLLSEILLEDLSKHELKESLGKVCKKKVIFPDGKLKNPDLRTLTRKYNALTNHGIEGLFRKRRSDIGQSRIHLDLMFKRAIELKKEDPLRGGTIINDFLESEFGKTLPKSTLYRHLKLADATKIKLGVSKKKVRKRWTKLFSNELWIGDFSDGPRVYNEKKEKVKTYLSAFIDCHSRYIVSARYYYNQKLPVLADTMIKGWVMCGLPDAIYVDNAKTYHSDKFTLACINNNVKVKYRPVRDPAAGGLIERFFQTVQMQFEHEIKKKKFLTLSELNIFFTTWLHEKYHKRKHSALKDTPEKVFNLHLKAKRSITLHKASESFLFQAKRKVDKDFSDISLNGNYYKVEKKYRTDTVIVKYYPFNENPEEVYVYSIAGLYLCSAKRHNREEGEQADKSIKKDYHQDNPAYVELIKNKTEHNLKYAGIKEISYRSIIKKEISLNSFINILADLLGKKAGISDFSNHHINDIKACYQRIKPITDLKTIKKAFEKTHDHSLTNILQKIIVLHKENK